MAQAVAAGDETWRAATWRLPLGRPPRLLAMCVGAQHGQRAIERYRLATFWCLAIYQGSGVVRIGEAAFPIRPGSIGLTPAGSDVEYRWDGPALQTWAHFAPDERADAVDVPAMQDGGARLDALHVALAEVAPLATLSRARAEARLWDVLWRLAERAPPEAATRLPPAVAAAADWIEQHLADDLDVPAIARELDISPTHLNRLFRRHLSRPVAAWIRHRRVERARHLIAHSAFPFRVIAAQVGVRGPQRLNKLVRHELGESPKALRRRHRG